MIGTDPNVQYAILGVPVTLSEADGRVLVLHGPLRLGPGRTVTIRAATKTFQAVVLSAHVRSLSPESGPTYEVRVEIASEAGAVTGRESVSSVSPAVAMDISKKGERAA